VKTISISLDDRSITKAIKELKAYKKWVQTKTKELTERLALIGAREASVRFASAMYDGTNDVTVTMEPIENGYAVIASGQAVCFIEFGSGVYHNPTEPYPSPRPPGVVGIGEYGKGRGKRKMWGFYQDDVLVKTRGNPAAMPMWYATQEMENALLQIAREVFRS
jgi:hypothetical protein